MLRVGNFVILVMPGELTTMSGRRMREAVRAKLIAEGVLGDDAYVVIAGPANTYAHYVATREEYAVQRYEGASTIFGQCASSPFVLGGCAAELIGVCRYARVVHRQVYELGVVSCGRRDWPARV